MTRSSVVAILFTGLVAGLAFDLMASAAPNPYSAPAFIALGSGQIASGTHCTMLDSAPPHPN